MSADIHGIDVGRSAPSYSPRHMKLRAARDGLEVLARSETKPSLDWFKGKFTGKPHI